MHVTVAFSHPAGQFIEKMTSHTTRGLDLQHVHTLLRVSSYVLCSPQLFLEMEEVQKLFTRINNKCSVFVSVLHVIVPLFTHLLLNT